MKYVLIRSNISIDTRNINISIEGIFDNLKTASDYLMKWLPNETSIMNVINNKENYYFNSNNEWLQFDYSNNYLIYYTITCNPKNGYCGETYQIFEIGGEK